jgi:hypothetical protein
MSKKIGYAAVDNINIDSANEFNTNVYADAYVQQCLNYILNSVFGHITWDYSQLSELEVQKFFIQWLIDGYSALYNNRTINNTDILKAVKIDDSWNLILNIKKYINIDEYEHQNIAIVSDTAYINVSDYGLILEAKSLIYRKRLVDVSKLERLVIRKQEVEKILKTAMEKCTIPSLIAYNKGLDEELAKDVIKLLKHYKNGSSVTVDINYIEKIDAFSPNIKLADVFTEINRINKEICFILGLSDNIFSASGTELATSRTIQNTILMNIDAYIKFINEVLTEYEDRNGVNLNISVKPITDDGSNS